MHSIAFDALDIAYFALVGSGEQSCDCVNRHFAAAMKKGPEDCSPGPVLV
jgi:hypothetical protein